MSTYAPRMREKYLKEVVPGLQKEFKYKSSMQVPRLVKLALNQGLGSAVGDKKIVDTAVEEMSQISGQKAQATHSR